MFSVNLKQFAIFISIKYIQWILVYLFFTHMTTFITLFVIDKLMRIVFLIQYVSPGLQEALMLIFCVLIQFEELYAFWMKRGKKDQFYEDYDSQDKYDFILESFSLNVLLIPQILSVMCYALIEQSEEAFLLNTASFLFSYTCFNYLWWQMISQETIDFFASIKELVIHFSCFGLVFICFNVENFLVLYFVLNLALVIFMVYRNTRQSSGDQTPFSQILLLYAFIVVQVLFQGGIELRRPERKQSQNIIQLYSQRNLNSNIISKLIQLAFLLIIYGLFVATKIANENSSIKTNFIIGVLVTSGVSLLFLLEDLWRFVTLPFLTSETFIEIETYKELATYNKLHQEKKLDLSRVEYVNIKIDERQYNALTEPESFEMFYSFLFNYEKLPLSVQYFGTRDRRDQYGEMQNVTFNKFVYLPKLEKVLSKQTISFWIQEIEFTFYVARPQFIRLLKTKINSCSNAIFKAQQMPYALYEFQKLHNRNLNIHYCQILAMKQIFPDEPLKKIQGYLSYLYSDF